MNESNRGTMVTGILFLILGAFFLVINLIPGMDASKTWPMILIVLGIGFFLPALIWPKSRSGLSSLFIPGSILVVLGILFMFNTLTGIWNIWAIAWLFIPASVGIGLISSAWIGHWDRSVLTVGLWLSIISITLFALLACFFSDPTIKTVGAGLLIVIGLIFFIRSLIKKPAAG